MSDATEKDVDTNMNTPMTLLVQGLLIQGLRSSPEDYALQEGEPRAGDILYLKEVKLYSGGEKVAEMAHLALERAAVAGMSAGRVTLLGA